MSLFKDATKAQEMMLRVFNGKMVEANKEQNIMGDEEAITALCERVFGDGSVNPNPSDLHEFNNIVVKVADKAIEKDAMQIIKYFGNLQTVPADTQLVEYKRPHPANVKFKWSAIGSAPALKRVEAGSVDYIKIDHVQTAISYNPLTKNSNCVEGFKTLVTDIGSAKLRLIYETFMVLIEKAVTNSTGTIPTQQIKQGAGITIADFKSVAGIINRRSGGKPIFVADIELINKIADMIEANNSTVLTETIKDDIYNYELTNLRVADAVPIVNEYTTRKGFDTQFPTNVGYVLGSAGASKKPFEVALAGGLVQHTENEFVHGRVKMIVRQSIGIDLLAGENIGYISDDVE